MDITIAIDDESIEKLAEAIASKINLNGAGGEAAEEAEADDFGSEAEATEITLTDVQDAIKAAVGTFGKDKVKAYVKKAAGVDKVVDIDKAKYQSVLDGLKKLKK